MDVLLNKVALHGPIYRTKNKANCLLQSMKRRAETAAVQTQKSPDDALEDKQKTREALMVRSVRKGI